MRKISSGKNKPVWAVVMVALAAAVSFWIFNWWNGKQVAAGKSPLGAMIFSVVLLGAGAVALFFKRSKMIGAPLLMVGGVLIGIEAVKNVGPMNGLAGRYRRGQNRPAEIGSGMDRPASVAAPGMGRPAPVGPRWHNTGSGRANWVSAARGR